MRTRLNPTLTTQTTSFQKHSTLSILSAGSTDSLTLEVTKP